ncbi:hypothetical protein EDF56_11376 [Novosphingobium sp. PhB165]|nr:hypothetical protein [Novosphingobium sp. PhB165]TCM14431.1 hypothetical protein EDF56_11376 [Novosphingobium sp. PhB165]
MAEIPTHTVTVVEGRRGGGAGMVVAIAVLIAVIAGIYFFTQTTKSEARKDNAVENAANSIGNAANKAGDAAQDAAKNTGNQ